ncbi:NOP9 protein, partial [Upupa epops]|nr:NOP9 protein [Upupa epops]
SPALLTPASASLCLQVALQVLHHSQSGACYRLCDALTGRLLPPSPDPTYSPLRVGLQDPLLSRLLEAAIAVGGPQRLRKMFEDHLRGHLQALASHPVANHGVQRFLDHIPPELTEEVLSELGPALSDLLARGHPGVLTALAGACRRHPPLQQEALRSFLQVG